MFHVHPWQLVGSYYVIACGLVQDEVFELMHKMSCFAVLKIPIQSMTILTSPPATLIAKVTASIPPLLNLPVSTLVHMVLWMMTFTVRSLHRGMMIQNSLSSQLSSNVHYMQVFIDHFTHFVSCFYN